MTALNASDVLLAKGAPGACAIVDSGRRVTYAEVAERTKRAAAALAAHGVVRGDRVAILMNDGATWCAAFLGALRLGAVAVPLNTRLAPADLGAIVRDAGARVLVVDAACSEAARAAAAGTTTALLTSGELESTTAPVPSSAETSASEPAFWLYSSGTTGTPKAIVHSHANAIGAGKLLREVVGAREGTVVFATSKLFFAFALDNAFLGVFMAGATTILNERWLDPEAAVAEVARHRPHVFGTVPTFYRRLLTLGAERLSPFASVGITITGGERLPDPVFHKWREAVGTDILAGYGMSETLCQTFSNFPHRNAVGSCGVALDGVDTKLLDDAGAPVAKGEPGLLWVKHPTLTPGYRSEAANTAAFREGWFCTGDLFVHGADGHWYHQGRADDLAKIAGMWVDPARIEDAVLGDARVREAACVIVRDTEGMNRIALFVVAGDELDLGALRTRCEATLPRHCQPKWIRAVTELPRTASAKIRRFALRERVLAELAAGEL